MRFLLQCDHCHRQYDAGGRTVGERVRCACGTLLRIREPRSHDALVVRCSGCGGGREDRADHCRYCKADFTAFERDLDTVCPSCCARISNRARFCHHCGTRIAPEQDVFTPTAFACPACGSSRELRNRQLAQQNVHVLECTICIGLWLGHASFQTLMERTRRECEARARQPNETLPADDRKTRWRYRSCPVCDDVMVRRNFGRTSGVVVDVCGNHGVWFDAEELERILHWICAGGAVESLEASPEAQRRAKARARSIEMARKVGSGAGRVGERDSSAPWWVEVLEAVLEMLVSLPDGR